MEEANLQGQNLIQDPEPQQSLRMDENSVKGTCMLMCPVSEIEMREREGLIHVLETRVSCAGGKGMPDRRRMVKMFTRSAAGKDMLRPEQLRPPMVLKRTVNYLLSTVVCESEMPWAAVYMFVTDRLRSVRQDMIIQQPPPWVCCDILEPIIRFHAYAAYRLCEEPIEVYDSHLNRTHLNESLKQLLVCYDSVEVCSDGEVISPSRDQMEALYGLLHLGNVEALYRMLLISSSFSSSESTLHIALRMSLADFHNDYVTVCKLHCHLPPLLACVAALQLPYIQRKALSIMNNAYSSKNLMYPLELLTKLLSYSDESKAAEDCQNYGIRVFETKIHFLNGSFDLNMKECKPKKIPFINSSLAQISLPDLLLTASDDQLPPALNALERLKTQ